MNKSICFAAIVALTLSSTCVEAAPAGDAFTYQGRLTDNNAPANGLYDLSFTLHDVATGQGTLSVDPVQFDDVPVENGVFSVQLDFGGGYFTGEQRWLAIAVRDGASSGPYELLAGRQELTAAPYAQYALNVPPTNPRTIIPSITGLSGGISQIPAGGANASWTFAGPQATVSVATGQRITASAVGAFTMVNPGSIRAFSAICMQPTAGGAITPINGGNGLETWFPDGFQGQYRQMGASQTLLVATAGSFRVGLCVRNTSGTGLNLSGDRTDGWVMVSN